MKQDIESLYRFSLLVVGSPQRAEELCKHTVHVDKPLQQIWRELLQCSITQGEEYATALRRCGASERLSLLLADLALEERAFLLLKLLLRASPEEISAVTDLSLEDVRQFLEFAESKCVLLANNSCA